MKFVNLTPHEIVLCGKSLKSEGLARCTVNTVQVDNIDGVPVNVSTFGEVTGLPQPQQDTVFIVSRIVAEAVKGLRNDVLIVDKTIRDENGRIIGCAALARV